MMDYLFTACAVLQPSAPVTPMNQDLSSAKSITTFNQLLNAVDKSSNSSKKFEALEQWLVEHFGIPNVSLSVKGIADSGRLGNALGELEQKLRKKAPPRIGVIALGDVSIDNFLDNATSRVGPSPLLDALVVFKEQPDWKPHCLIAAKGGEIERKVTALFGPFPHREFPLSSTTSSAQSPVDSAPTLPRTLDELAHSLLVEPDWMRRVLWLLEDRRAIILYGPPGTGKTYIARAIAEWLQPRNDLRSLVQLHPSYTYEDFFEGYRPIQVGGLPVEADGQRSDAGIPAREVTVPRSYRDSAASEKRIVLDLRPGPLRKLATAAENNLSQKTVLVIDEMNRGNLPRVFGELYLLLEYRDEPAKLMYSDKDFRLPKNLCFIGTMNTADKSVALMDQALRRRFHFVGMFPEQPPVRDMLRRYLHKKSPDMLWVADVLDEANRELDDRHVAIGPSHFMRDDLDDTKVEWLWEAAVLPTIEEHFFGQPDRVKRFELERLKRAITRGVDDDNASA